jgi:perosamine synthetase
MQIPLFKPYYPPEAAEAVGERMRKGWTGLGPKVEEFEEAFRGRHGGNYAIGMNSCTAALRCCYEFVARYFPEVNRVYTTPLTFVATASEAVKAGFEVEFVDQPSIQDLGKLTPSRMDPTYASMITPVLYGGNPKVPDFFGALNCPIIFDCAHAAGSSFLHQGLASCWSFQAVKNLSCGDGGMILTDNSLLAEFAKKWRWFGISKSTHERTTGGRYSWDYDIKSLGEKAHMNDITASIGLVQLENLHYRQKSRQWVALNYCQELSYLEKAGVMIIPGMNWDLEGCSWHLFPIMVAPEHRDPLMAFLKERGIGTGVHYKPLNHYPIDWGTYNKTPVVDTAFSRLISLPMGTHLGKLEVEYVCDQIRQFFQNPKHSTQGAI